MVPIRAKRYAHSVSLSINWSLDCGILRGLLASQFAIFCFKSNDVTARSRGEIYQPSAHGLTLVRLVLAEHCLRPELEIFEVIVTR